MFNSGDILGDIYRIEEQIGIGGGGIIFKAYHLRMEKYVAIKLIKDEVKGILKNRAEVDLLKNLRHEYIPQVYDFIEDGNDVYTVMDFIEGENMKQIMSGGKKFSEAEIKKYALELCDAVAYLHHKNPPIIHSDIKPENIMLTPDDNICLIDFNISMMSSGKGAASLGGSKGFAAPEQYKRIVAAPAQVGEFHEETRFIREEDIAHDTVILDENGDVIGGENESAPTPSIQIKNNTQKTKNLNNAYVDTRTDIYGMGATLYNLLTGRIRGENGSLDFRGVAVSSNMQNVIRKAMNPDPEKRFRTVEEMKKAIAGGKNTLMIALSAVACVAVICAAVIFGMVNNRESVETIAEAQTSPAQTTAETTTTTVTEEETEIEETQTEVSTTETAVTENTPVSNILGDSRYYEYKLTKCNSITDAEEFNNNEAIEKAVRIAKSQQTYEEEYNIFEQEYNNSPMSNASCELSFFQGITADFDKNGTEESFFILYPNNYPWTYIDGTQGPHGYLFYCDDSQVKLMSTGYYVSDNDVIFKQIMYNDFSHVLVNSGVNNSTICSEIYSINGDDVFLETRFGFITEGYDDPNLFLACRVPQVFGDGMIFWDNEEKGYKTPEFVKLTDEEIQQVDGLSEIIQQNEDDYGGVILVGNKYYSLVHIGTYKFENDKLTEIKDKDGYSIELITVSELNNRYNIIHWINEPTIENIDFNKMEEEMERLETEVDSVPLFYEDVNLLTDDYVGDFSNEEFEYSEYEHHISITKYVGNETNVEIPEKINDKWVMEINVFAFSGCSFIESIFIPESMETIGIWAFSGCTSLTEINASPEIVERIKKQIGS